MVHLFKIFERMNGIIIISNDKRELPESKTIRKKKCSQRQSHFVILCQYGYKWENCNFIVCGLCYIFPRTLQFTYALAQFHLTTRNAIPWLTHSIPVEIPEQIILRCNIKILFDKGSIRSIGEQKVEMSLSWDLLMCNILIFINLPAIIIFAYEYLHWNTFMPVYKPVHCAVYTVHTVLRDAIESFCPLLNTEISILF